MLDYRGIEALHTVLEVQNFELAAKKLFITQSAVSQRIKGLEEHYGEPLLIRNLPYRPTRLGKRLIGHYKKLCLLEDSLAQEIGEEVIPKISIAVNRDSLETWFLDLIEDNSELFKQFHLEVIADDQELTLEYLKNGVVLACLSTSEKELPGASSIYLGNMRYLLVASPLFVDRYFPKGVSIKSLQNAPALKFDKNDHLHARYLEKFFGINDGSMNYYMIPSVKGFKKFTLAGCGYALIPKIDIINELERGDLLEINPNGVWEIPLYWHFWDVQSKLYQSFNKEIVRLAKKLIC